MLLKQNLGHTSLTMVEHYRFKRGDRLTILWGRHIGATGVVDSAVFQRTVDYPDEHAPGYPVVLDDGTVVMGWWDQVAGQ